MVAVPAMLLRFPLKTGQPVITTRLPRYPLSQELPLWERGARVVDVQQTLFDIFAAVP